MGTVLKLIGIGWYVMRPSWQDPRVRNLLDGVGHPAAPLRWERSASEAKQLRQEQ